MISDIMLLCALTAQQSLIYILAGTKEFESTGATPGMQTKEIPRLNCSTVPHETDPDIES